MKKEFKFTIKTNSTTGEERTTLIGKIIIDEAFCKIYYASLEDPSVLEIKREDISEFELCKFILALEQGANSNQVVPQMRMHITE